VAAISQDTPARRALPQTGPSGDHKFTAASMVNPVGYADLVCGRSAEESAARPDISRAGIPLLRALRAADRANGHVTGSDWPQ